MVFLSNGTGKIHTEAPFTLPERIGKNPLKLFGFPFIGANLFDPEGLI